MFSIEICQAHRRPALTAVLALLLVTAAVTGTASADDRDLLRTSTSKPYLFIVLDTSGSMNWTPPCSQADFNAGKCRQVCPYGDCFTPMQADDVASKAYIARESLYEVLRSVTDVEFGFATYNQDTLSVKAKHFLYIAGGGGVTLPGSGSTPSMTFPPPGAVEVFGDFYTCTSGSNIGCGATTPADLNDSWELTRIQRLPKGDFDFLGVVTFYVRWAGTIYKVTYTPKAGSSPGAATNQVVVKVDKCTNSSCSNNTNIGSPTIIYTARTTNGRVDEFLAWESGNINTTSTASNPDLNYFGNTSDIGINTNSSSTCSGWDSNQDTSSDSANSYDLRFPTINTDTRGGAYYLGDVIPFDWKTDHELEISRRLSPSLIANPGGTPDFRSAPYLKNVPNSGQSYLRLKDDGNPEPQARPLFFSGSTPLGATMSSFRNWYANGCSSGCSPSYSSWKSTAAAQDPDWGCRRKYLLVITDGDDTCNNTDPCSVATTLKNTDGILTYVIGLGFSNTTGNKLNCMASNGGTGAPIYPQNKQELVDALTTILGQIKEQASAFASAAVPSVQADVADKIFISTFTPLNGTSFWSGRIDAYLKPLPLTDAGLPNSALDCGPNATGQCHLWNSGGKLLFQAPTAAELAAAGTINASVLHLGLNDVTQRRVFYGKAASGAATPRTLRLFYPPPSTTPLTDSDWQDLFAGYNIPGTPAATATTSATQVTDSMKNLLVIKSSTIDNGTGSPVPIDFVLGDTFHADPVLVDRPSDFERFKNDLYGNGVACGENLATGRPLNPGYVCWTKKQQFRRKMLAIGADDGQIHFFDAGLFHVTQTTPTFTWKFDNGTGRELFSVIPRLALPIVRDQTRGGPHIFGLDSTPRIQEAFIDPSHNGTPTVADRQWRTLAVGGFREGGKPVGTGRIADFISGYYALDISQPDTVNPVTARLDPNTTSVIYQPTTNPLPDCLTLANTAGSVPSGCGQVPFPALLWEFTDSLLGSRLDEDINGTPDLGQTWSVPVVGRIRLLDSLNQPVDRWVAIFGGGMDGDNKSSPKTGTYVYIIDVETSQVLYKQKVNGAVPADPAVVDKDNDGIFDAIYIGTTAGFLYRIDMSKAVQLQNVSLLKTQAIPNFAAVQTVQRITDASWNPVAIFDTGGKPIYEGAVTLFLSALNATGIMFGSGDREDLWNISGTEGRFYLIVDQGIASAQNESQYTQITPTGSTTTADLVTGTLPPTGKNRGWYMRLRTDERLTAKAFGMVGLIFFSTYQPDTPEVINGTCGRTGTSYAYTVYGKNGNPLLHVDPNNTSSALTRFQEVDVFLAPPTVELGGTKNPPNPDNGASTQVVKLSAQQQEIMKNLMSYFPRGTRFGNLFYTISAMGSDTRYVGIAAIPMGMIVRNWKVVQ